MNSNLHHKPHRAASWLLHNMVEYTEDYHAHGDFEEEFHTIEREKGILQAHIWYWLQVLLSLPEYSFLQLYWSSVMIKNYIMTTFRNLLRQKLYTAINILGLAVGLAASILLFLWVQDERSYDTFQKNADNLYAATFSNGSKVTPSGLGNYLKTEYEEVENAARTANLGRMMLTHGEDSFMENDGFAADPAFLTMFSVQFIRGNPETAFSGPMSIVLSQTVAQRIFGNADPIGQTLTASQQDFTVTAVIGDYPHNSFLQFAYLIPFTTLLQLRGDDGDAWQPNWHQTYVQLLESTDVDAFNLKIADVVHEHREREQRTLSMQPFTRLHLYDYSGGGRIYYVYLFSAMALFILIIACINFMNLSTARASTRAKEIGIRKTVGASRPELIKQFFSESFFLTICALAISIVVVILLLPTFSRFTEKPFTTGSLGGSEIIIGILVITLFTGLLSGMYPAILLSSFHPVRILKGTLGLGGRSSMFRKVLVIVQFTMSIFLIVGTLIVYRQLGFMKTSDPGFDTEHVIYFGSGARIMQQLDSFKEEMLRNPDVVSITTTNTAPYRWSSNAGFGDVHWEGQTTQQSKMVWTTVDHDYMETLGLQLTEGRFFSREFPNDAEESFVVNEAAVRAMEMENPIGKWLEVWDIKGTIIGVLKDYHYESLHESILPMAMRMDITWNGTMCVRIRPENTASTISYIEEKWKSFYPEYPFEYNFLDESIAAQYTSEEFIGSIFRYFTLFALFVACLGLLGLSSFMAEQRTKEIGIRKVFGAPDGSIVFLLSKEFVKWVAAANIIALPAAYLVMGRWLENFAYRIPTVIDILIVSSLLALLVAVFTVSFQAFRTARTKPADTLRYE
ncbi:ABC transporter permease [candidate division KSB1 bacterium]